MTWDYIAAPKKENLTKTFDVFSFFPNNSPFLNFPQKIFLLKIIHDGKILEQYQCLYLLPLSCLLWNKEIFIIKINEFLQRHADFITLSLKEF